MKRGRDGPEIQTIELPGIVVSSLRLGAPIDPGLLTEEERALFDRFPADREKRRGEWWAGRMAARAALEAIGIRGASILRDPEGRPIASGAEGAQIAITHGKTIAAAAASIELHAGIDVVDPEDQTRLERIAERVLRGPEPELALAHPQDGLRLIWGAREAIAKATHTGMFAFALTKAHVTSVDRAARRMTTNREGIEILWVDLEGREILVIAGATDAAVAAARAECS